jgi:hypothetical protein
MENINADLLSERNNRGIFLTNILVSDDDDRSINFEENYVKTEYYNSEVISEDGVDNIRDRSRYCYVCEDSKISYFYHCGNGLCRECLIGHLRAQLDKYKPKVLTKEVKFICAGSCRCPLLAQDMIDQMDISTKDYYYEILLKLYLNQQKDVLACPVSTCKNYGFYNPRCVCLECNLCGYKWEVNKDSYYDMFKTFIDTIKDVRTIVKKYLITKSCNNCNAPIEKNEGCVHIECNRCEYSFCWRCTSNWNGHSEYACMGLLTNEWDEAYRPDFIAILFVIVMILFAAKLLASFKIILVFLYYLAKVLIGGAMLAGNTYLIDTGIHAYLRKRNSIMFWFLMTMLLFIEILLYLFKLHPFSEWYYFYIQMTGNTVCLLRSYFKYRKIIY